MKKKHKALKLVLICVLVIVAGLIIYISYDNSRIVNSVYHYNSEKVPKAFDGYRIVLLTDFHNEDNYEKLAKTVREASPDIIVIGGDLVSMNTENFSNTKKLVRALTDITTVYYTYGNHEVWSTTYNHTETPIVADELKQMGLVMLNNKVKTIEKDGELINLTGFGDSVHDDADGMFLPEATEKLTALGNTLDKSVLSVLVFHRAQYFDTISELPYDIMLSGHLHGGQVNLPIIKNQVLMRHFGSAEYCRGEYEKNGKKMYVCGGTALKDGLYRIFNTPEIVTVVLSSK